MYLRRPQGLPPCYAISDLLATGAGQFSTKDNHRQTRTRAGRRSHTSALGPLETCTYVTSRTGLASRKKAVPCRRRNALAVGSRESHGLFQHSIETLRTNHVLDP
jgi:hypothetical protein